jgi:cytochrome c peroxidase
MDGVWRIPSLRNVALTAPYFHNGSVTELAEAVRVMATAQLNAEISDDPDRRRVAHWNAAEGRFERIEKRILTNRDVDDIVAFLNALTSDSLAARVARK